MRIASVIALARLLGALLAFELALCDRAFAQNQNDVARRCLSIADVDARVECLETGVIPDTGSECTINPSSTKQSRLGPSFDCRAARTSIERAICSDTTLSEWDYHMGRLFQQALEYANDRQSLLENQRFWLGQRDTTCGAVADTAIWTCLFESTKIRANALAQAIAAAATKQVSQPSAPTAATTATSRTEAAAPPSTRPSQNEQPLNAARRDTDNSFPVFFVCLLSAIAALLVFSVVRRRQRLIDERKRFATYVSDLTARYGEGATARILAHEVWQGMTEDQLRESRGHPSGTDREIKREKTRETWKYHQIGKNRFRERIYLEDGIVIGWKH